MTIKNDTLRAGVGLVGLYVDRLIYQPLGRLTGRMIVRKGTLDAQFDAGYRIGHRAGAREALS
jgi:hypothetical protein